jgi:hypothetical protein
MVRVIAAFSLGVALGQVGEFLKTVGVETPVPITEQVLVQSIVRTNDELVAVRVLDRYFISYWKGKVRLFTDRDEPVYRTLSRLDPQEMVVLSQRPCVIDEERARQIACEIFYRLGYEDKDFEPPDVHRFTYQPNEFDSKVLPLPYFHVQWDLKGEHRGDALDPYIRMVISGTTEHLIYYSITSLARFNR